MPKVRGRVLKGEGEGIEGGGEYGRVLERWTSTLLIWMFAVSLLSLCCLVVVSLLSLSSSLLFFKQPKTAHHRRLWDGECVEIEV